MKIPYAILFLNLLFSVAFFSEHWVIGTILISIWLISAVGLVGFHKTGKKGFATTAYAGFAPFFPIGLLAIIGVRRRLEQGMASVEAMPEPIKIIHFSRRFLKTWLILGLCLIAAQIITQIWLRFPNPLGAVGLVFVIISLALRKSVLMEIFPDNFTYKPGILTSKKKIYYSDILDMEKTKKQLSLKLKGSKRPQKIMLDLLEPVDREELVAMLSKDPL